MLLSGLPPVDFQHVACFTPACSCLQLLPSPVGSMWSPVVTSIGQQLFWSSKAIKAFRADFALITLSGAAHCGVFHSALLLQMHVCMHAWPVLTRSFCCLFHPIKCSSLRSSQFHTAGVRGVGHGRSADQALLLALASCQVQYTVVFSIPVAKGCMHGLSADQAPSVVTFVTLVLLWSVMAALVCPALLHALSAVQHVCR